MPRRSRVRRTLLAAVLAAGLLAVAPTPAAAATTVEVAMRDSFFQPASLTIKRRDSVRWVNRGRLAHVTQSSQGLWERTLAPGASYTRRFTAIGTFRYVCTLHRGMTGTITVTR